MVEYVAHQLKKPAGRTLFAGLFAVAVGAMLVLFMMSRTATWQVLQGHAAIEAAAVLLFAGLLGLAFWRHTQIIQLQTKLVQDQGEELQLAHTALNSHALVCLTDPGGKLTWANDKFLATYGYELEDLKGTSITRIYHGGAEDPVFKEILGTLAKGKIWTGERAEITAEGETVYMQCTIVPFLDEKGRHKRSVAIRTDNSEHHRAEKARYLKDLFDHLQDEVYIYDAKTLEMVYANLSAIRNSNLSLDELSSMTILDAHAQMERSLLLAHLEPLVTGQQDVVRIDLKRGEGSCEVSTRHHTGEDGQPLFVSIVRDTTERTMTEQAKMESVSIVSHELRTPLTSIKGALRLVHSGALGEFNDKTQSVLDIAVRNTERLLLVVDDILDLEKIRAGKMELKKSPVDLVDFVDDVVEMNKGYADEHDVTFAFETDLDSAITSISGDRMTQVLSNLLSNAAKYSPAGGTVRVVLEPDEAFWRISVSDDGPGIPEESRATVFDSFSQIDSVDGKRRKGTGLGLTISQKIVEAHKGQIDFTSEVNVGTTFFVRLPRMTEASAISAKR